MAYAVPNVQGRDYVRFEWKDGDYGGGASYYYIRVTSEDGHLAFSTPVWVVGATGLGISAATPRSLATGATLDLPEAPAESAGDYALRLTTRAETPGEITIISGGADVASAKLGPNIPETTVRFRAASPWDVRLRYEGSSPLELTGAATFPYPWREAP